MNNEIKDEFDANLKRIKLLYFQKKHSFFWPIFLCGFIFFFAIPLFYLVKYKNRLCDIKIKSILVDFNDEKLRKKSEEYSIKSELFRKKINKQALKLLFIAYFGIIVLLIMFFVVFNHANYG